MQQKKPNVVLKDHLIQETAEHMELPIELIQAIISFQGEDAAKAAHVHNEIEFSGLGKLLLSQYRTKKKIEAMENKFSENRVREEDMEKYLLHLAHLKTRIDE